jgi:hypothetical protein
MPTVSELKAIYQSDMVWGGFYNTVFKTTAHCVWSGQMYNTERAWYFHFRDGLAMGGLLDGGDYIRAFAVRPGRL